MKGYKIVRAILLVFTVLVFGCTNEPAGPLNLVENYEQKVNAHDPEAIIALYTEDARLVFMGDRTFYNQEEILEYLEYDCGLNATYTYENCSASELSATCEGYITDDLGVVGGWGDIHLPSVVFSFTEAGLIKKLTITNSEEDDERVFAVLSEFFPWVEAERPAEFDKLFGTEGFIFSEANARLFVDLLKQWQVEK